MKKALNDIEQALEIVCKWWSYDFETVEKKQLPKLEKLLNRAAKRVNKAIEKKTMAEEFDTEEQALPTCPYCGHEDLAYFELDHDEPIQVVECDNCGKEYSLEIRGVAWLAIPLPRRGRDDDN